MEKLKALKCHRELAKLLMKKCKSPHIDSTRIDALQEKYQNYDHLIKDLDSKVRHGEQKLARAQVLLHQRNVKFQASKNQEKNILRSMNTYVEILYDVKYAIACILDLPTARGIPSGESKSTFSTMSQHEFVSYLLSLMTKIKTIE